MNNTDGASGWLPLLWALVVFLIFYFMWSSQGPAEHGINQKNVQRYVAVDGDTFKDTYTGTWYRLYSVDTPERYEPYYHQATLLTNKWLQHKDITTECTFKGKGKYKRTLIYCSDLEDLLIKAGYAKYF